MNEQTWLTASHPLFLWHWIRSGHRTPNEPAFWASKRKLRLWCAALFDRNGHDYSGAKDVIAWREGVAFDGESREDLYGVARSWATGQHDDEDGTDPPMAVRADLLREIMGNPFRPIEIRPEWLTWNDGTVRRLAEGIYRDAVWSPDRLAILADALEEAGAPEDLSRHLRGWERCPHCLDKPGWHLAHYDDGPAIHKCLCDQGWQPTTAPHVRGCHVLDALTGRS